MGNSDISIKETLQEDVKIPEIVNDSLDEAYDKIRKDEVRMKSLRSRSKKRLYRKLGVVSASSIFHDVLYAQLLTLIYDERQVLRKTLFCELQQGFHFLILDV